MDKRVVDSGRVGERAKEALVDGLNGLVNDASLGVVFCQCAGGQKGMEGRCVRGRKLKKVDGSQICWNTW